MGLGSPKTPGQTPVTSPLKAMAEALYGSPSIEVKGQLPSMPASHPAYGFVEVEQWNAVILHRRGLR